MAASAADRIEAIANKVVLVTGASFAIGVEFCSQLLAKGNLVLASARKPLECQGLINLKAVYDHSLVLLTLDVDRPRSIQAWVEELGRCAPRGVDVLINNAGIFHSDLAEARLENVQPHALMADFVTNCMGFMLLVQALVRHNLLPPGSLIVNVNSQVGSLTENQSGGLYSYRCSKAAANMASKCMAIDLASRGITCTILNPGLIKTDVNDEGGGAVAVEDSVQGMIRLLESGQPLNGQWYHGLSGRRVPW